MSAKSSMSRVVMPKGSKEPSASKVVSSRQVQAFVPTEQDAKRARARMRPEVRKAYEKSLKQFGGAYKRLADM